MASLMSMLRSRQFLELVVVVLLSALIWVVGPYVAIAGHAPLESLVGRLVGILLMVVGWALSVQFRAMRADRAGAAIAAGLSQESKAPSDEPEDGPDSAQIRRRFDEAMTELRKNRKTGLYDLPWFVIIGPPGAGKTTVLANSGLDFPLSERFGREGLRGVGGTRNCDWWFTDEAVLIDTAGRFTTQDSDAAADRDGWLSFLRLLKKNRPRRPINGVLLALSISDLMTQSEDARAAQVKAIRSRLREVTSVLEVNFPVYLLLTKSDLLTGFSEFFDDLDREGRSQVLGFTVDLQRSRQGVGRAAFDEEFDTLVHRLSKRVLARLESERDPQRRALLFAFCEELAGIKSRLSDTVEKIFAEDSSGPRRAWLRGAYLTSGTQEGTPIDRMLGALAQVFSLDVEEIRPAARSGRAYFIERLLREVVLKEAALAGLNPNAALRSRFVQSAGYVGAGVFLAISCAVLAASHRANSQFLQTVQKTMSVLEGAPSEGAGLEIALARLDAIGFVREAVGQAAASGSWFMGFGLSTESTVSDAIRDAYSSQGRSAVVREVVRSLESRLGDLGSDPDRLYEYLRAYLMLGDPERLEPESVASVARAVLLEVGSSDPDRAERIARHFDGLLQYADAVGSAVLSSSLVDAARASLRHASPARLGYQRFRLTFPADDANAIRLDRELGLGSDRIYSRASGRSLADPESGVFTRKAFDEFRTTGSLTLIQAFLEDSWVLGPDAPQLTDSGRLMSEVIELYEKDYIRHWDELLGDLQLKTPSAGDELVEFFRLMGSPSSPFRALFVLVDRETNFAKAKADPATSAADAAGEKLGNIFGASSGPPPGARITEHFKTVHDLIAGEPAPIDGVVARIGDVATELESGADSRESAERAIKVLQGEAKLLPPPFGEMLGGAAGDAKRQADGEARGELSMLYQVDVVEKCRNLLSSGYPFSSGGDDIPLNDVEEVLGEGGVFKSFFDRNLSDRVERASGRGYRWRSDAGGATGSVNLTRFEAADRAREVLFQKGGSGPSFKFHLTADSLDAKVTRMQFEMDGQSLEYQHGPPVTKTFEWPGDGAGQAAISFEMMDGGRPNRSFSGSWALFRILDEAQIEPLGSVRFRLGFDVDGAKGSLILEATARQNPIGDESWRGFRCQ